MEAFDEIMAQALQPAGDDPVYNCMLSVRSGSRPLQFVKATGATGPSGEPVTAGHRFRTGSITKLFTATVVAQLAEEGLISLEDTLLARLPTTVASQLARLHVHEGIDRSAEITVRHLLQHTTGLPDFFAADPRFLQYVLQHPTQVWNWQRVMEMYFACGLNERPAAVPGTKFHYSDTNYLLLALLIEQLTDRPLHQVYQDRIIAPLQLADTYLEFYEQPAVEKPVVYPFYGTQSLETVNTSFDWGGGGLVSTLEDLTIFVTQLFDGHLVQDRNSFMQQCGPGIQHRTHNAHSFYGQRSAYGAMLFYEPRKGICIALALNQAKAVIRTERLWKRLLGAIAVHVGQ